MLTILKHFLLTGIDGRKAIRRIAQPQPEGLRSSGPGAAPQQAEKPFVLWKRNGWFFAFVLQVHCLPVLYQIGYNSSKQCLWRAICETLISAKVEMRVFCLLRLCPNPRRTQFCVLETLEKSSSYAILQIAKWASTPVLFRFSRHGERKVSCRCQQDCHKHQPRLPPHQQHRAFLRCRRCRAERTDD